MPKPNAIKQKIIMDGSCLLCSKPGLPVNRRLHFLHLNVWVGSRCLWYLFPFLQNLTDLQLGHLTSGLSNVIGLACILDVCLGHQEHLHCHDVLAPCPPSDLHGRNTCRCNHSRSAIPHILAPQVSSVHPTAHYRCP